MKAMNPYRARRKVFLRRESHHNKKMSNFATRLELRRTKQIVAFKRNSNKIKIRNIRNSRLKKI